MSELAVVEKASGLQIRTMEDVSRVSKMLAQSGYFTDARDAAQCGVKVIAGLSMGIDPFSAMTGIHIIKGKPSVGAGLMASAIKRHPKYDYRVVELSDKACRIQFFENGEKCGLSEFTAADAKAAGTQNMQKFAKNMLFARAISNGVKFFCPDVFDAPVYTPEEMGATVDGEGEVISVEVEPEPQRHPVGQENNVRFRVLAAEVGMTSAQIKAIAQELGLSAKVAELTAEETEALVEAVKDAARFEEVKDAEISELKADMQPA